MSNFKDITTLCIEQIKALLTERLMERDKKPALSFAESYLSRVQSKELVDMPTSNAGCMLMSAWRFIRYRLSGKSCVRAYNPSPEEHQWHSTHTVIEVVCDDQPFLVASILMELERQGIQVHSLNHVVYEAYRDNKGSLVSINQGADCDKNALEFFMHVEVDRQVAEKSLDEIELSIWKVLGDVCKTCRDWTPMRNRMLEIIAYCHGQSFSELPIPESERQESLEFLSWLTTDKFVFIGYSYHALKSDNEQYTLTYEEGSGLGLLDESGMLDKGYITPLSSRQLAYYRKKQLLVLTKSTMTSTIHRPGHLDHVGIKHYKDGEVVGEWQFCGLLSSAAYIESVNQMPLVRNKVWAIKKSHATIESHRSRVLDFVLNQYPRDEFLQSGQAYLEKILHAVVSKQERRQLGVFLRTDNCDQFVTAIIYIQKEFYSTALRHQFERVLMDMFDGHSTDFNIVTTDHPLSQVLLRVYCQNASDHKVDIEKLEQKLCELVMRWEDRLQEALVTQCGEGEGKRLHRKYCGAFPAAYREDCHPLQSVMDIEAFEKISSDNTIGSRLYHSADNETGLRFRVFGQGQALVLSDVLPIIERMGVRVISARPYEIRLNTSPACWIIDFVIMPENSRGLETKRERALFQEVFVRAWSGEVENDRFNALVINARLSWRDITLIRAMSRYLFQLKIPFSQHYMEEVLNENPDLTKIIVNLFYVRFNPGFDGNREAAQEKELKKMEGLLEKVASLDEDRIFNHFISLVKSFNRTNFFQTDNDFKAKPCISFKLSPKRLSFIPEPRLEYEIFVYSPKVEGVHMRAGKIARGGLRWSDRKEDFRTEVLGLVKAQMIKNSVIVPVGAKGGFVARQLPQNGSREAIMAEGIACYRMFISAILDITDNMKEGVVLPPENVVRHDEDDPYMVVAADKGTASFSDIANSISSEYNFWLGDAFASGGCNGYDHKGMGITAKGAWESVKRLFWTQGVDIQKEPFTVVGIGDMSGDVFGNGMLLSRQIRLVAAFNHQHIFIDPDPCADKGFSERHRLFNMSRSSWDDYDRKLISEGGGVFSRALKTVPVSAQMKKALDIQVDTLTPTQLIQTILRAPVDLLWNGGIGTYVKASSESHEDVGDHSNDSLRINALELRASVIGEGGNLGLTQKARIGFSGNGGLVNTDAVDNSAGVDCSDHEVNMKILLNQVMVDGEMTEKQRNLLLKEMTDEVSALVLGNNYLQTKGITLTVSENARFAGDHRRQISALEKEGRLDRQLENLPSDEDMALMQKNGGGLTRPEASVVLAHVKLKLFDELVQANVDHDTDLVRWLYDYFPGEIQSRFNERIVQHPLKAEILATHLANTVCNRMGACFIDRIQQQVRCESIGVIRAFMTVCEVFGLESLWKTLESEEYLLEQGLVCEILRKIRRHVEKCVIWLLNQHGENLKVGKVAGRYVGNIGLLEKALPDYLNLPDKQKWKQTVENLTASGMSIACAKSYASLDYLYYGLHISDIAASKDVSVKNVANVYYTLDETLTVYWLRDQLRQLPEMDLWQRKARGSLRERLDVIIGEHCLRVLEVEAQNAVTAVALWSEQRSEKMARWSRTITELQALEHLDLSILSVVVKELARLVDI